RDVECSDRFS
ncbi:hypothetical protein VCHENC02_1289B, partial [Vibrio harveyi]